MRKILKTNLIKKLCLLCFVIYISMVFINQQQKLNSYGSQKEYYIAKIDEAKKYNQTLNNSKDDLESKEYIESISREKLDMYSKNERVYININK